ncbi:hypothetical protein ABZP36_009796 [Zizania latifolia]
MEPVSGIVGTIFKLVQAIDKAASTARRNEAKCRVLAQRAQEIAKFLRQQKAAAATTTGLGRLKGALDDALKLVESCHRRGSLFSRLVGSGRLAAKLDDVNGRITDCLVDLSWLNSVNNAGTDKKHDQLAARDHSPANNSRKINAGKNGNKGGWNKGGQQNGGKGGQQNGGKGGQQNGGKGGKRGRGKKAAGRPSRPHAGAGVPFFPAHHHSMEEDPTSCSVM